MKTALAFLLAVAGPVSALPVADRTAWQWEAPLEIVEAGRMRLDAPPPVRDAARADLGDLRVLSPAGVETPYLVEVPFLLERRLRNTTCGWLETSCWRPTSNRSCSARRKSCARTSGGRGRWPPGPRGCGWRRAEWWYCC